MWNILLCCRPLPPLVPFSSLFDSIVLYFCYITIKVRSEIAIASLLLDYINETSQTNHPGPSHLALREQGMGICLIFINSIVDQVVFF